MGLIDLHGNKRKQYVEYFYLLHNNNIVEKKTFFGKSTEQIVMNVFDRLCQEVPAWTQRCHNLFNLLDPANISKY